METEHGPGASLDVVARIKICVSAGVI